LGGGDFGEGDAVSKRAVGITILALSAVMLAVAIGLSVLGRVNPAVQVIPFTFGVPGLFLGWITYRNDRDSADDTFIYKVTDFLAETVLQFWQNESRLRGVNDTDYLAVPWEPAGDDLVETWPHLLTAAARTPGALARVTDWRPGRSGSGSTLATVLERVPTGRLVVLGEPGSGKTVVLMQLLIDLLEKREAEGLRTPVPVMVQLGSWDPSEQKLRPWLVSQLLLSYRDLKNPWRSGTARITLAEELLNRRLLLPILDGLDEIPDKLRRTAITEINGFLIRGMGIILSSRTDEYREALKTSGTPGRPLKLAGAAGISLRALSDGAIRDYLIGDASDQSAVAQRWQPVLGALTATPPPPVAQALRTPLIVWLARTVYDPLRPSEAEDSDGPAEPAELCDEDRFPSPEAIKSYLFRAFISSAYEPREDPRDNRWNARDAERWLSFLALQLRKKGPDYNILRWWELRDSVAWLVPAVAGIVCGLAAGLAAGIGKHVGHGIGIGLGAGALVGLAAAYAIRRASRNAETRPSHGIAGALISAIAGALLGAVAGKAGIGHAVWPFGGLAVSLAIAIGVGSSTNFWGGLAGGFLGGTLATVLEGIGSGWPAGLMNGAGMGFCAALAARFVGRDRPAFGLDWSPVGAVCGLAIGVAVGLITERAIGLRAGLLAGAAVGMLSAIPCGLTSRPQPKRRKRPRALSPRQSLRLDHRAFWMTATPAGIAAVIAGIVSGGLVSLYAAKLHPDLDRIIHDGLAIGVAAGVIIGLGFGLHHAASGFFFIARFWLATRRVLPWRFMTFLDDAHVKRKILKQSGTFYQFSHGELKNWLAASPAERLAHGREPGQGMAQTVGDNVTL
jgi:hypothetical protein